jgi:hypothetical protein
LEVALMVLEQTKYEKLQILLGGFDFYLLMSRRYLEQIGRELVAITEHILGEGSVDSWSVGNYEDPNCVAIHINPSICRDNTEEDTEPYDQVLYELLKTLYRKPPTIYIDNPPLLSPQERRLVAAKFGEYLDIVDEGL